ncbi:hypothetical protein PTSG_05019 [Salpingoeca rosetta]|uniref:DNA ligase 4 n=1 Tax=Salpingoeca rosetta (strain ATCC 50818 / BSB-021) TaxID=946362 RepID=F2U9A1_SALR5|nr:uncharacterized protein PTSG_05019 [Salpingoeca rosetta]EGD73304.1 hypothetical protein PTSG_05019 [Salpingoeca rosetta]|eukprot:XP_004994335.1 hypothetical protein PTSG_05019 [Salpingoeca rosetta]
MVGFDRESKSVIVKGDNFDVKALGRPGVTRDRYPTAIQCYIVFDLVLLNGEPWYDRPLRERKEMLARIITPDNERIILADYKIGRSNDDFLKFANAAIDEREEGVMIKDLDSKYLLGRRDKAWMKWKPEYVDTLADDLDLLVVGGYHGEGTRRSGGISHFLLAVAEPPQPGEKPTMFNTFCKVGTGYSLKQLREIQARLRPHWKTFNTDPRNMSMSRKVRLAMPGFKEKPDVWIEPEESIIVQVKAAEICPTEKFAARFTLRFPRLQRFRLDKNWWECMLQTELMPLYDRASGKIAHRALEDHHFNADNGKLKAKRAKRTTASFRVAEHFKAADLSDIKEKSKIFSGLRLRVIGIDRITRRVMSKQDIERKIKEFGGTPVQRYEEGVLPVSDMENITVRALPQDIDIVKTSWVLDCCRLGLRLAFNPKYLLRTSTATAEALKEQVDAFGDSYEEDLTEEDFDEMLARLTDKQHTTHPAFPLLSHTELAEVEVEYTTGLQPLRLARVFLDMDKGPAGEYSTVRKTGLEVLFLGGQVMDKLDRTCTHVLVDEQGDLSRVAEYDSLFRDWPQRPKVVGCAWVKECVKLNREVDEAGFMVKAPRASGSTSPESSTTATTAAPTAAQAGATTTSSSASSSSSSTRPAPLVRRRSISAASVRADLQ